MDAILEIKDLTTTFKTSQGTYDAIDKINLCLAPGELLGIVGESGCGKSVTFLSCMRLLDERTARYKGEVILEGQNMFGFSEEKMRRVRGKQISMIFQEPMTCLNPLHKVGRQIMEVYKIHTRYTHEEMRQKTLELLKLVGINDAEKRMEQYPHELSGGMRQRIMIAIALACEPQVLIADEPTTALDVTIQMQILSLMKELKAKINTAIVLVTHDLGVIANMVDRVVVMYAGQVVEEGPTRALFREPLHPYTQGLLKAVPRLDEDRETLYSIDGRVPAINRMPAHCRFAERCPRCEAGCKEQSVGLLDMGGGRKVRCLMYRRFDEEGKDRAR